MATEARRREHYSDVDALLRDARAQAGLDDFGDGAFRLRLALFLDTLRRSGLGEEQAEQVAATIRRRLVNRLQIEDWIARHPEVTSLPIHGALAIGGMPRTGTTALVTMLSQDEEFRCLRNWEQYQPCPPPIAGQDLEDPRRLAALAQQEWIARERPDLVAMHLFDVDATEEDVEILGIEFAAQQLALPIYDWHAAWRDFDLRPAFAYHRRVMQLLQSRRPPYNWLFKAPAYNFCFEAIASAYPEAKFLMTHRDPAKAVVSSASFVASMLPDMAPEEAALFGRMHSDHLLIGMERAIASRAQIGEDRFLDVHHRDFVRDPFGELERVYAFLGRPLRPALREKLERWHAGNRSGAHGRHSYRPEQYGLDAKQIRADFAAYIDHFGVAIEG